MDKELQQAINDAIEVAKTGTTEEKQNFVAWACTAINWFSSQFNEESKQSLQNVMAQYKSYLEEQDTNFEPNITKISLEEAEKLFGNYEYEII